LDIRM